MADGQLEQPVPERLTAVVDLIDLAGRLTPSTAVVPGGHRVEDLRLVESARDHGIVDRIILVGDKDRILAGVSEVGIEISPDDIVAAADDDQAAAATVDLIRAGTADIVLKGDISTPIINRHMLPLAVRSTVSLATVFDASPIAGGRPLIMTDSGVTTVCNFGRLVDLVRNAVDVAHVVGIVRPRVAILSANEKQIPSLPSTRLGLQLARRTWPDAVVCGPLSFDLATDPGSVLIKGLPDLPGAEEVAGQADVLVCPGIDAANILYKTIAAMNKYGQASLASVTVGFPVPYIILSRSDSLETRLVSIALCAVYARHRPSDRTPESVAVSPPARPAYRLLTVALGSNTMRVAVYDGGRCPHVREFNSGIAADIAPPQFGGEIQRLADLVCDLLEESPCGTIDAIVASATFPSPAVDSQVPGGIYFVAEQRDGRVHTSPNRKRGNDLIPHADADGTTHTSPKRQRGNDLAPSLARRASVDGSRERDVSGPANPAADGGAEDCGVALAAALSERLQSPALVVVGIPGEQSVIGLAGSSRDALVRCDPAHVRSICEATRRANEAIGLPAEDVNLVVAHLSGETTVAVVRGGKIVDIRAVVIAEGGLHASGEGDDSRQREVDAALDRAAREIGGAFVASGCEVDAIVLTSQLTGGKGLCAALRRRVGRLAPVTVLDESLDLAALAEEASEVLSGRREAKHYPLAD